MRNSIGVRFIELMMGAAASLLAIALHGWVWR